MVNPVLTLLFDLFLVGSALAIVAAMVQEYLASRRPSVGGRLQGEGRRQPQRGSSRATSHTGRERVMRKVA